MFRYRIDEEHLRLFPSNAAILVRPHLFIWAHLVSQLVQLAAEQFVDTDRRFSEALLTASKYFRDDVPNLERMRREWSMLDVEVSSPTVVSIALRRGFEDEAKPDVGIVFELKMSGVTWRATGTDFRPVFPKEPKHVEEARDVARILAQSAISTLSSHQGDLPSV